MNVSLKQVAVLLVAMAVSAAATYFFILRGPLLVGLHPGFRPVGHNLLKNPSFEDGDGKFQPPNPANPIMTLTGSVSPCSSNPALPEWKICNNVDWYCRWNNSDFVPADEPPTNKCFLDLVTGAGAIGSVEQDFPVANGLDYEAAIFGGTSPTEPSLVKVTVTVIQGGATFSNTCLLTKVGTRDWASCPVSFRASGAPGSGSGNATIRIQGAPAGPSPPSNTSV